MNQFLIDFNVRTVNVELVQQISDMDISGVLGDSGGLLITRGLEVFAELLQE